MGLGRRQKRYREGRRPVATLYTAYIELRISIASWMPFIFNFHTTCASEQGGADDLEPLRGAGRNSAAAGTAADEAGDSARWPASRFGFFWITAIMMANPLCPDRNCLLDRPGAARRLLALGCALFILKGGCRTTPMGLQRRSTADATRHPAAPNAQSIFSFISLHFLCHLSGFIIARYKLRHPSTQLHRWTSTISV